MINIIKKSILCISTGMILFFSSHVFSSDCPLNTQENKFSESDCSIPPNGSGLSANCNRETTCGKLNCEIFIGVDYGDDVPLAYLYKNSGDVFPDGSTSKLGLLVGYKVNDKKLFSGRYSLTEKRDTSKVNNNEITWTPSDIKDLCNEHFTPPSPPKNIQIETGVQMFGEKEQLPNGAYWAVSKLTWDNLETNTSYKVEYCTSNPCPAKWPSKSCTSSPCLITLLSPDQDYFFKVSSTNNLGAGTPSTVMSARTAIKASVYGLINGLAEGNTVQLKANPSSDISKSFTASPVSFNLPYGTTSVSVIGGNGQTCTMEELSIPEYAYHRKVATSGFVVFERNITCD